MLTVTLVPPLSGPWSGESAPNASGSKRTNVSGAPSPSLSPPVRSTRLAVSASVGAPGAPSLAAGSRQRTARSPTHVAGSGSLSESQQ